MKSGKLTPWLIRSSVLAMGTGIIALGVTSPSWSQSFLGSHTVVAGQVDTFDESTPGVTNILLNGAAPQTVIDWVPSNAPNGAGEVVFQPGGTTATFSRGGSDFAVLNRILPSNPANPIRLDGTILGRSIISSVSVPGGSVYFYSPGGIIVGSTARIDVGALGLTTAAPMVTGSGFTGGFMTVDGAGNKTVRYGIDTGFNPSTVGSKIVIEAPSNPAAQQITAPIDKYSYVSLFAPYVEQGGKIDVNGSTALVAGRAGTLTWNANGLFNVQVTLGTDGTGGVGIRHSGTTGGTVGSGTGDGTDNQRVYLVNVPRNSAVTTLIQGGSSLGFNVATAADLQGNTVILSGGSDVTGDSLSNSTAFQTGASAPITITNSSITSRLIAKSRNAITVSAVNGVSTFASDVFLIAPQILVEARNTSGVTTTLGFGTGLAANSGHLILDASDEILSTPAGFARMEADSATISVNGLATLDAHDSNILFGGTAVGGEASILVSNGAINIGTDLNLLAYGQGSQNGAGRGGSATVTAAGANSTVTIGGGLNMTVYGFGGDASGSAPTALAGAGTGGVARILGDGTGSGVDVNGAAIVNATAIGGFSTSAGSGDAAGGTIEISSSNDSTLRFRNAVTAHADATSGRLGAGSGIVGAATGGNASISLPTTSSTLTIDGDLTLTASGFYADNSTAASSVGLTMGGTAAISANGGVLTVNGTTIVRADASNGPTLNGGEATGGSALISANGIGQLNFNGDLTYSASAFAGTILTSGTAGAATGGTVSVSANNNGVINASGNVTGDGDGEASLLTIGSGGAATGGDVSLGQNDAGVITIGGTLELRANAFGGGLNNGVTGSYSGGAAQGGSASVYAAGNGGSVTLDSGAIVNARAFGGSVTSTGGVTTGGNAIGGSASIGAAGTSTMTVRGMTWVDVKASGGDNFNSAGGGAAGTGRGGNASVGTTSATTARFVFDASDSTLTLRADGDGGSVSSLVGGATGTGGTATISVNDNGVALINGRVVMTADGLGGSAGTADGGTGTGGTVSINGGVGSVIAFDGSAAGTQAASLSASGTGGVSDARAGGLGTGGSVRLVSTGAAISFSGNSSGAGAPLLSMTADGTGGLGNLTGDGGNGFGGLWTITSERGGAIAVNGSFNLSAVSTGADGANGGSGIGGVGNEFRASGGSIVVSDLLTLASGAKGGNALARGGTGGNATGSENFIVAESDPQQTNDSFITLAGVSGNADAMGGTGGDSSGLSSSPLAGGIGGNATAGYIDLSISSQGDYSAGPNGFLTVGDVAISQRSIGGAGGAGGSNNGIGANGADGGAGGVATGGLQSFLGARNIISFGGASTTAGADYGNITIDARVTGGDGGAGGAGGPGQPAGPMGSPPAIPAGFAGIGGNGGNAVATNGINGTLYVEGQRVTLSSLSYNLDAQGGNGGAGIIQGNGGDATSGGFNIIMNARPNTGQRGTLIAGSIDVQSNANGGAGNFFGQSFYAAGYDPLNGTGGIAITDSDLDVGFLRLQFSGSIADQTRTVTPLQLALTNAKVNANTPFGAFIFDAGGDVLFSKDVLSSFAADYLEITGTSINGTLAAASGIGSLTANSIYMQSSGDLIFDGSLNAPNSLSLSAFGTLSFVDLQSLGGISLSGTQVSLRDLTSGGDIDVTSYGNGTTVRDLNAVGRISLHTPFGGNMAVNSLVAGESILINGGGDVAIAGTADAGDSFIVSTTEAVTLSDAVTAGIVNPSSGTNARYDLGVYALGSVQATDLTAAGRVLLTAGADGSAATDITTGQITAGTDVLLLANGTVTASGIASSGDASRYVYIGSSSALSSLPALDADFASTFAAVPASLGAVTINGPISGGNILFASSDVVTVGAITAQGDVRGRAGSLSGSDITAAGNLSIFGNGAITLGDLQIGGQIEIDSFSSSASPLTVGTVTGGKGLSFSSSGDVQTGAIDLGDFARIFADNTIVINGTLTTGINNPLVDPLALYSTTLRAFGGVQTGAISSASSINIFASSGAITTGALSAASDVLLLGSDTLSLESIVAGGRVRIASYQMTDAFETAPLIQTSNPNVRISDVESIFQADAVAFGGNVGIGSVSGGDISFATTGSFAFGALSSTGSISGTGGSLLLGSMAAAGAVTLTSTSGDLSTGAIGAGRNVALSSFANVSAGAIEAGDAVSVLGNDVAIAGAVTAGIVAPASSGTYGVGLGARGNLSVGAVNAAGNAVLRAGTGTLGAGAVTAGGDAVILGHGATTLASIATGAGRTTYISDSSLLAQPSSFIGYNPASLIATAPAQLPAALTVTGGISTGQLRFAGTGAVSFGSISVSGQTIGSGGTIDVGSVAAGTFLQFDSLTRTTLGTVTGAGSLTLNSGGNIGVGSVSVRNNLLVQAGGTIDVQGLARAGRPASPTLPGSIGSIAMTADGSIRYGDMAATGAVTLLSTAGSIAANLTGSSAGATGSIASGSDTLLLARTGVSTGALTAPGRLYIADAGMASLGGGFPNLNTSAIFAAAPVAITGGGITNAGPITAGQVNFAASGAVTLGAVTATGGISGSSGTAVSTGALSGGAITLTSSGALATGNVSAAGNVSLTGGTTLTGGTIAASGSISAFAPTITLGSVGSSGSWVRLGLTGNGAQSVTTGAITAAQGVGVAAVTNIHVASVDAGDTVILTNFPGLGGNGTITVDGAISAGITNPFTGSGALPAVSLVASRGIVAQNIRAANDIQLQVRDGALVAGALNAGRNVGILGSGDVRTGAVVANGGSGAFYVGNISQRSLIPPQSTAPGLYSTNTSGIGYVRIDPIFAVTPTAIAGNLTVGGAVSAGTVQFAATGAASLGDITSASLLSGNAGSITAGNLVAGSELRLMAAGDIAAGNLTAPAVLSVTAGGALTLGDVTGSGDLAFASGTSLTLRDVDAGGILDLDSGGALTLRNAVAKRDITLDAGGAVATGRLDSGATVSVRSGGLVTMGAVTAGIVNPSSVAGDLYDIGIAGFGSVRTGALRAAGRVGLTAGSATSGAAGVDAGPITAATDVLVLAKGDVTLAGLSSAGDASRFVYIGSSSVLTTVPGSSFDPTSILASAPVALPGDVTIGGALTGGNLLFANSGRFMVGDMTALGQIAGTGGSLQAGAVRAPGAISLAASSGALGLGSVNSASGSIALSGAGAVTAAAVNALNGSIAVAGQSGVTLGNLTAGGAVQASGTSIDAGTVSSGTSARFDSAGRIALSSVAAGTTATFSGGGLLLSGPLTARDVAFTGTGLMSFGDITAIDTITGSTSAVTAGLVTAGGAIRLTASNLAIGSISGGSDVTLDSSTIAVTGATSGRDIRMTATGDVTLGPIAATGRFIGTGANWRAGTLDAGNAIQIDATGGLILGATTGRGDISLRSGLDLVLASVTASGALLVQSGGGVSIAGAVGAGTVAVSARGNIGMNAITATRDAILVSNNGAITLSGAMTAGTDALLLARNGVTLGNLTAGTGGRILIADSAMAALGGTLGSTFNSAPVLAATPVSTNGAIRVNGAVTGGSFRAASRTDVTLGAVTANLIDVRSDTGLLALSGNLGAPDMSLTSADIAIGSGVMLRAGVTGLIRLTSTNGAGMRIGDGTAGQGGYLLDKTEFSALNSGSVVITAPDIATLPIDMTIGTVNVTGPLAGSTIDAPNGTVAFVTGSATGTTRTGTIRVTGELRGRGFRSTNGLEFITGRFEMDANTGLIELLGAGNALSGTLFFDTPRIHVAESSILSRLIDNPTYAGRAADLNRPLATARPDGVVRVGTIELGEADAVLVQNSGTTDLPAGFLTTSQTVLDRSTPAAPGSIDLIINGQLLRTDGDGRVTNRDVLNVLINDTIRGFFTPDSGINGCFVSLSNCQDVTADAATPFLQSGNLLAIAPAGDDQTPEIDEEKREAAEREARKAPIAPPTPLISTTPLNPVIDVDEPVAGSGNPAMIGSGAYDAAIRNGAMINAPVGRGVSQ